MSNVFLLKFAIYSADQNLNCMTASVKLFTLRKSALHKRVRCGMPIRKSVWKKRNVQRRLALTHLRWIREMVVSASAKRERYGILKHRSAERRCFAKDRNAKRDMLGLYGIANASLTKQTAGSIIQE